MKNYTDKELLDRVKTLKSYTHIPELLLIGVRSKADIFNQYDDKFYFYWNRVFITHTTGTTNPGSFSLLGGWKSTNKIGSAIVKSDEIYYDVYGYGLHKGKMPALRQIGNMKYFRDNDNDKFSEEIGKEYSGNFATAFHFNDYNIVSKTLKILIGGWSEGCQVANVSEPYNKIINLVKSEKKKVSYALLKEF